MVFKKGNWCWKLKKTFKTTEETKNKISNSNKGKIAWNKGAKCLQISREKNGMWKCGKHLRQGYVFILKPEHPFHNNYIQEHRLVMEEKLGRYLTKEEMIHHIDFDKTNNNIDNLYLFPNQSEHREYHCFLKKIILDEINGN